jgi:predicted nucleic acid-binding protein
MRCARNVIVVDACVLANALADDGDRGEVARLILRESESVSAPDLVDVEAVSVLRKRWLAGDLPAHRFRSAVDDLSDLPIDRYPSYPLMRRAYELRANVSAYDSAYVALAEVLDCPLVTVDERLARASGTRCEFQILRA